MLFAAVAHAIFGIPVGDMAEDMPERDPRTLQDVPIAVDNLITLSAVLDLDSTDLPDKFEAFRLASSGSTQRIRTRKVRFPMSYAALLPGLDLMDHAHQATNVHLWAVPKSEQTLVGRLATKLPTNPVEARECKPVHHDGFAFQMIRIQHLWGEFCRELVVRSAMGGCTTRTGNQLSRVPHVSRVSDLPKVTKLAFAGRGSNWEEPKFALKTGCYSLGLKTIST